MKTRKHGHGMTHKQVVHFSNRLAAQAHYTNSHGFDKGWAMACRYFAHELREALRYCEKKEE